VDDDLVGPGVNPDLEELGLGVRPSAGEAEDLGEQLELLIEGHFGDLPFYRAYGGFLAPIAWKGLRKRELEDLSFPLRLGMPVLPFSRAGL
jgi:hypothetical protein